MNFFNFNQEENMLLLKSLGKENVKDLFTSIPKNMLFNGELNLPNALSEQQLKTYFKKISLQPTYKCFIGAGATPHYIPEWVNQQLLRSEWYSPYTPYQPEVSQGHLQALFQFQTQVANLFGQEISNASLYDGATALVEAILLAHRVTKRKKVLLPLNIHPQYLETVSSYLKLTPLEIITIPYDENMLIDLNYLESFLKKKDDISCLAVQTPNFFGLLENTSEVINLLSKYNIFSISVTTDISSLALLQPLGEQGFNISVGDGIGLCGNLSMGGPSVGLFATQKEFIRQIPGRIVGLTSDKNGKEGYVLTLSTREQHIRREKAVSNICTNHNLMAIALSMALVAYGKKGLLNLALACHQNSMLFREELKKHGINPHNEYPYYNETVIKFDSKDNLDHFFSKAQQQNIIPGVQLGRFFPNHEGELMIGTSDLHEKEDLTDLVSLIRNHLNA